MAVIMQCDACGAQRRVGDQFAGKTIRCPACREAVTLPSSNGEPTALAAGAARGSIASSTARNPRLAPSAQPVAAGPDSFQSPKPPPPASVDDFGDDDDALPPRKKRPDDELDMTPMVDVTFLLLIFFMVTASFSLQKSVQMPKQTSDLPSMNNDPEETEELDPIELQIDDRGAFLVLDSAGEYETPGKQNLVTRLRQIVDANAGTDMRLDIKVHENAKLQAMVDGMDAGTIAGFSEIQVVQVDGFD